MTIPLKTESGANIAVEVKPKRITLSISGGMNLTTPPVELTLIEAELLRNRLMSACARLKARIEKEGKRDLSELESLDDFLQEEGILEEVTSRAQKRVKALRG